ncbi:chymotrypsin-like protease CTRL-1 [Cloeon dipterum]|uniref:chymotrypsin-like protease CTRL-1 n=1 Tax=Cloeon dipterum TaxID=197152 RepID=UPI00321F6775
MIARFRWPSNAIVSLHEKAPNLSFGYMKGLLLLVVVVKLVLTEETLQRTEDDLQKLTVNDRLKREIPAETNQPSTPSIGKRIINNNPQWGSFKWHAIIGRTTLPFYCGGSLILPQWVLTAASCSAPRYEIRLGEIVITTQPPDPGSGRYLLIATYTIVHELYDSTSHANDIALIKLPTAVNYTDSVQPIRLPFMTDAYDDSFGESARVTGNGQYDDAFLGIRLNLMNTEVTVINNTQCASYYGSDIITQSIICTFQNGTAPCTGDEGGPLVYTGPRNDQVQIGIVSFYPFGSCLAGPTGYTRVSSYLDWISKMTGQDFSGTTTAFPPSKTTTKKTTTIKTTTTKKPTTTKTTTTTTKKPTTTKTTTTKKPTTTKTTTTKKPTTTTTKKPTTTKTTTLKTTTTKKVLSG